MASSYVESFKTKASKLVHSVVLQTQRLSESCLIELTMEPDQFQVLHSSFESQLYYTILHCITTAEISIAISPLHIV